MKLNDETREALSELADAANKTAELIEARDALCDAAIALTNHLLPRMFPKLIYPSDAIENQLIDATQRYVKAAKEFDELKE